MCRGCEPTPPPPTPRIPALCIGPANVNAPPQSTFDPKKPRPLPRPLRGWAWHRVCPCETRLPDSAVPRVSVNGIHPRATQRHRGSRTPTPPPLSRGRTERRIQEATRLTQRQRERERNTGAMNHTQARPIAPAQLKPHPLSLRRDQSNTSTASSTFSFPPAAAILSWNVSVSPPRPPATPSPSARKKHHFIAKCQSRKI